MLEKEKEHPAFVAISQMTFQRVVGIVRTCQDAGILNAASPELMAMAIWGQVHGIISLMLEGQISHTVLDQANIREIVLFSIGQMTN